MTHRFACLAAFLLLSVSVLLTGCSLDTTATPVAQPGVSLQGLVHGGRQGVSGAHVYLLAATTTGYGGSGIAASSANASVSLLIAGSTGLSDSIGAYVLTGSYGQFTITGDYTCPTPTTQVYLYALGGNSGSGVNAAGGFLEALGPCGNLTSSTSVYVDEVTTVAAAYALAGFATDATHIGSSATALAQTGIAHAFAAANNLVNAGSGAAYATTPAGNGTVPQTEINALANSLAGCINSTGGGFTQCTTLFKNATSDGVTCASPPCADQPTDTASAAINIAHFPTKNVATIFGLAAGVGTPFLPALSAAPATWTVTLTFSGGGLSPGAGQGEGIAVDASGNLWIVPVFSDLAQDPGTVLCEFSPLGVPANASGFTGLGLNYPNGVAIDLNSTHVWIASFGNDDLVSYAISNGAHTAFPTGAAGVGPLSVAIDSAGFPWVANTNGTPWVVKLNPSTGAVVTTPANNGLGGSELVAFEPGSLGNLWVANGNLQTASLFTNAGAAVTNRLIGQTLDVVIDAGGNAWFSGLGTGVTKVNSAGTSSTAHAFTGAGGNAQTNALALDGAGNLWAANNDFNSATASDNAVFELNNSGTTISGSAGYVPSPATSQPNAVAVDGSGNVWYTSQTDSLLRELVGAAVPVTTPLSYATANSLLATRP